MPRSAAIPDLNFCVTLGKMFLVSSPSTSPTLRMARTFNTTWAVLGTAPPGTVCNIHEFIAWAMYLEL